MDKFNFPLPEGFKPLTQKPGKYLVFTDFNDTETFFIPLETITSIEDQDINTDEFKVHYTVNNILYTAYIMGNYSLIEII